MGRLGCIDSCSQSVIAIGTDRRPPSLQRERGWETEETRVCAEEMDFAPSHEGERARERGDEAPVALPS